MMYFEFMKNFLLADSGEQNSYFLEMMYVEFMKNFLLSDSGEQIPVRLISASWAQKRQIPIF